MRLVPIVILLLSFSAYAQKKVEDVCPAIVDIELKELGLGSFSKPGAKVNKDKSEGFYTFRRDKKELLANKTNITSSNEEGTVKYTRLLTLDESCHVVRLIDSGGGMGSQFTVSAEDCSDIRGALVEKKVLSSGQQAAIKWCDVYFPVSRPPSSKRGGTTPNVAH